MYSSVRSGATTENLNILKERLSTIDVSVVAEVGSMNLTVRDVLNLRGGDVIRFPDVRTTDPMTVKIGNRRKFLCRPGVVRNKMAVQITEKLEEISREEFEELVAEEGEEV
jgi:flagellar motor switch protein FliM